ncbi:hypothetical protein BU14_0074s0010 [Porphyra umbilicalis]|uniref:histone deacetylase n=1 Tax=Porphyra umbilicalis TaxID=2786 RepID=A0A1X6PFF7_PORUM|nr:hypothetical protein BU14_0074s0010 [Porphyra umbilicalis]|eukprot:OSX79579.1 hypothetical protein BU14_0074s0010 [Porphyra umbilicalis]
MSRPRVAYFMDTDIGGFYYAQHHPMKPHRLSMTYNLCLAYGLYREMEVYRPRSATPTELTAFHSDDYISFLRTVTPDNASDHARALARFNVGRTADDCPLFDGLYDFCALTTGGSIDGAKKLAGGTADIAINWAGGLHHAKKSEASGFCYVNDIVLAILELLTRFPRVLYIDIDVHHGDGVEEAFYTTDRVMTVSLHKYGDSFFPGTGDVYDTGAGAGAHYAVNFPLRDGIDDASYERVFRPVLTKVFEVFRPSAVVLQCGADSLANDRLGCFNLTLKGHAACVEFVKSFNVPTLVLGGGGYNIRSVARCWTYETAVCLGTDIDPRIPYNDYWEYYAPDFELHIAPGTIENKNDREFLDKVKVKVLEGLRSIAAAPSVQMAELPPGADLPGPSEVTGEDKEPADRRGEARNEFFAGDIDVLMGGTNRGTPKSVSSKTTTKIVAAKPGTGKAATPKVSTVKTGAAKPAAPRTVPLKVGPPKAPAGAPRAPPKVPAAPRAATPAPTTVVQNGGGAAASAGLPPLTPPRRPSPPTPPAP